MIKVHAGNGKLNLDRSMATQAVGSTISWFNRIAARGSRYTEALTKPQPVDAKLRVAEGEVRSLHGVLEVMPAAALVLDDRASIAWANGRATQVLGYALDELVGMPVERMLLPSRGNDRPVSFANLMNAEDISRSVTGHAVARTKGGADIDVRVTASPSVGPGPVARFVIVVEPDKAGLAVSAPHENEQRRLHRQSASEVGDMAAALAHEIDQPLTAILSNAQAAQRFLAQNPPALDDLQELLAEVVADSARAHAIIRTMRQSARREPPETSTIDTSSLVRGAVRLVRRETQAAGAAITASIEDPLPPLRGDAVHLQQVLVNLLLNALDAVHECDAEDREVGVIVTATADRGKVCIAIRDRGCGVDADQFATLFKPFVTSKPEGLGLGLSISRTIVMAHGGRLWAERNADRGLTFHIELPAQGASGQ
ncbi:MAG TPA: PAS domain-containing sensor histidine kinase [Paraburkholderia sp.]|uniref:two-component system sensor histidine kinase NtrB n=1 Tax=Paraburkholderia sp. TaxID=1926495 RepID=UPI002B5BA656|nr:PAS domain-containing sensor histidine kinase [Paraburkholderia sp.]HTR05957.1 PAS domain-containing sensor histidine kinase [Paraburkholderia sp.]